MAWRWIGYPAMVAALAALATATGAQLRTGAAVSAQRAAGGWQPARFVCDSTDRPWVMVLSPDGSDGAATLTSYAKPGLATHRTRVRIGRGEPGMGQVWYPLTDADDGRAVGNIHTLNPAMVEPGATTPTVTSITYGRDATQCRFAPQTRVLGVTAQRSIQVTRAGDGGYRYRSYNHDATLPPLERPWGERDTQASLTIDGGRLVERRDGRRAFEFVNLGYTYRVLAAVDGVKAGGGVQVWRDGRLLLTEPFVAYTAAVAP